MYYRNMSYLAEGIRVIFPLFLFYKHAIFLHYSIMFKGYL